MEPKETQSEPRFDALWPLGRQTTEDVPMSPRLTRLSQAKIGFLWDHLFRGDEMFGVLQKELHRSNPHIQFVDHAEFGDFRRLDERDELAGRLRAAKVDAVVIGVGA